MIALQIKCRTWGRGSFSEEKELKELRSNLFQNAKQDYQRWKTENEIDNGTMQSNKQLIIHCDGGEYRAVRIDRTIKEYDEKRNEHYDGLDPYSKPFLAVFEPSDIGGTGGISRKGFLDLDPSTLTLSPTLVVTTGGV